MIEFNYNKKFDCIYADPPWEYSNKNTGGSISNGTNDNSGAASKYNTMSIKDIARIPVWKISSDNSCLFMWAVTPLLPEAFHVMKNWGYTYKTTLYWRKKGRFGMGFWFRGDVEPLLIGIKGKVKPFGLQISNFLDVPPREHSRKPDEVYRIIESIEFVNKLEMFAREKRQGWEVFGNQVPGSTQNVLGL